MEAAKVLMDLYKNKHKLSGQAFRTLKGQIESGDVDGARKGLRRIMRK